MKLHLPKTLLAAVIGVMAMSPLLADTRTITNDNTNAALEPSNYANLTSSDTLIFALTDTSSNRYWNNGGTINANIVIGSDTVANSGMYIYNGNTGQEIIYTGTVTGSGTMSKKHSGTDNHWKFRGDVSGFSGAIHLETSPADNRKFYLDFENAEGTEPVTAENVSGTGTITFASGTGSADNAGGNWLTYNYTTSTHTTADTALTVGNVITRSSDNIQSRVEIKGTAAMKFTNAVTLAKLKLSTNPQDVTLTSGLVENITGTTGHTIRKTGTGELTIGNTTGNNLVVSEGKLKIKQGYTASFASLSITGGTMEIYGTFHVTEAVNVEGGSLNVMSGAWIDTSELNGVYAWDDEASKLTYTATLGTGWTIDSGAIIGIRGGFTYDSTTGQVVTEAGMQVVSAETFTWGGDNAGNDDANNPLASSGSCVRFAGGSAQSVTLGAATSTPFLLIAEGTTVTMTRGANTFTADAVRLEGSLRITDNTGYTVTRWSGDGELILSWGDFRTNAASIANFAGNLRIAAGTGLRIGDAGRTFSKVTVEDGAFFCINNNSTVDGTHQHVGDIYISGDGLGEDDTIGALKFGEGRRMKGDVHIVGGSASISGWHAEHGYINGSIIGEGGNTTTLKTLNADPNGSGQLLDVMNITGVGTVNLSSGTLNVTGDVTNNGGFTKEGAGTLIVNGNVDLSSSLTVKSGTLIVSSTGTMGTGNVTVKSGGTLAYDGGEKSLANVTLESGATLEVRSGTVTLGKEMTVDRTNNGDGANGNIHLGLVEVTGTLKLVTGGSLKYDGLTITGIDGAESSSISAQGGVELSLFQSNMSASNVVISDTVSGRQINAALTNVAYTNTGDAVMQGNAKTFSSLSLAGALEVNADVTLNGENSLHGVTIKAGKNLTIGGTTSAESTALENATLTIDDGATYTTGNQTITKLTPGTVATISGTGAVSVATQGITYTNTLVDVTETNNISTIAASLHNSKVVNNNASSSGVDVSAGSLTDGTNDVEAASGDITISGVSESRVTVKNLTVQSGKTVSATAAEGSSTTPTIVVAKTANLEKGSTVIGNVTIAESGTLVIGGTGFSAESDALGAVVVGTLTANATAVSLANKIDVSGVTTPTKYVLATAQGMTITGNFNAANFYTGTLADGMKATVSVQPMEIATHAIDQSTASQLVLSLTEAPVTLTATAVGTHYDSDTDTLYISVGETLDTTALNGKDLAVSVDSNAWKSIVTAMSGVDGGVYNNAFVTLTNTNGTSTLNIAGHGGAVTLNGYSGTGTKGEYFVAYIPEPATATLSLLALAALAARRRRKDF